MVHGGRWDGEGDDVTDLSSEWVLLLSGTFQKKGAQSKFVLSGRNMVLGLRGGDTHLQIHCHFSGLRSPPHPRPCACSSQYTEDPRNLDLYLMVYDLFFRKRVQFFFFFDFVRILVGSS